MNRYITPPSLSYFLFRCCFSMLSLSLEKLLTCGVIRSFNFNFSALIGSIVNITLAWCCLPPKRHMLVHEPLFVICDSRLPPFSHNYSSALFSCTADGHTAFHWLKKEAPGAPGPNKSGVGCLDFVGLKVSCSNAKFLVLRRPFWRFPVCPQNLKPQPHQVNFWGYS